ESELFVVAPEAWVVARAIQAKRRSPPPGDLSARPVEERSPEAATVRVARDREPMDVAGVSGGGRPEELVRPSPLHRRGDLLALPLSCMPLLDAFREQPAARVFEKIQDEVELLGPRGLDRQSHRRPTSTTFGTANSVGVMRNRSTAAGGASRSMARTRSARSWGVCERASHASVESFVTIAAESMLARMPASSTSARQPSSV